MASERIKRRIEKLLDEADEAVGRRDWPVVRDICDAVLRLDPENKDAMHFLDAAGRDTQTGHRQSGRIDESGGTAPQITAPVSFAGGRYIVKKLLGEGGKKKVYLAHDTTLDRDVAFGLIKAEALDDAARKRIVREAQAMGRLGDHPNIVPIYDLGIETGGAGSGQPYMVQPVMEGGDVEGLITKIAAAAADARTGSKSTPAKGLPLDRVVAIARDVCEGLAFAHSKGIVHRDLKPGNVWLTARGSARIGDFGLALPLGQSRLTREGFMVGTVAYMPPEQAMGGEITPRADLYSLGAMLYEMVTGRPPFLGDDDIAIVGQHINTSPVAPSWHRPDCPRPLEALILRLLAKSPDQRPDSATDVLLALDGVDLSTTAGPPGSDVQSPSLDSMSSGVFVGRHREMDQLRAVLEEALSGHGRMVTIVGEPGIGKTRTAFELATYAGLRRFRVLWGRCYEGGGAPPYWPWVQAIRQYVQEREAEFLRAELGSTASAIAEIVPEIREKFRDIQSPPRIEDPESARFRLFDSIASFLRTASRAQPIIVVLDDLHWSDKPTLLLLEFVARELASSRVLVIGTYRDVELNRRHPLSITLGDLTKERLFERVLLRGLQKEDVARFIELAAGIKPPPGLVDAAFTQTEGNPLFVTEVVRLLIQEGHLSPGTDRSATGAGRSRGKTTTWTVRVPEGVREVIGRRLDRLPDRCNDILSLASVIGRQFSLKQLHAVLNDPSVPIEERVAETTLLQGLEEALAARVVEELHQEAGRYQFTHALIQETLLEELSSARRVRLHARIAVSLERLYGDTALANASELVRHFAEAESVLPADKLRVYARAAGLQALRSYAYESAVEHLERANALRGTAEVDAEAAEVLVSLSRAQFAALAPTDLTRAVENMALAFGFYERTGEWEKAANALEHLRFNNRPGILIGSVRLFERALRLVPTTAPAYANVLNGYGKVLTWEDGRYEDGIAAIKQAIALASKVGDTALEADALVSLALSHKAFVRIPEALETARLAVRTAEFTGDDLLQARANISAAHAALIGDRIDRALEYAERALSLSTKTRMRSVQADSWWVQGAAQAAAGDWESAESSADQGLPFSPRGGRLLMSRFQVAAERGNFEDAVLYLDTLRNQVTSTSGAERVAISGIASLAVAWDAYYRQETAALGQVAQFAEIALASDKNILAFKLEAMIGMALAAVMKGDREEAGRWYVALEPYGSSSSWFWRSVHRILGLLAHVLGEHSKSEGHFSAAIGVLETAGWRPQLAWACAEYADVVDAGVDANAARTDRVSSGVLRDRALGIATELKMRPLIDRTIAKKRILKA